MPKRFFSTACSVWCLLLLSVIDSSNALSAPPTIERLSVNGLQSGGTTALAIEGANLTPDTKVFVPDLSIALQQVKPGATAQRMEFELTVDSWVSPGIYDLRVVTAEGISNRLPLAVDALPQLTSKPEIESLPVALSGSVSGNQTLSAKFPAKKSQKIVLEIEAQRIGSQLRPVLHIYDERHVQVAWAGGSSSLGEDTRIVFQPPADGTYSVELHDSRYAASAPGYFRLKIGEFEYADVAIPAAVQVGTRQVLRFAVTNLPAGAAAEFTAPAIAVRAPVSWPVRPMLSGPRPALLITDEPQAVEAPAVSTNDASRLQELRLPGGITGQLRQPREVDRYRLTAPTGKKVRLRLYAQRLGSPLDGVLSVLSEQGEEIASGDDGTRTTDPALEFSVPKTSQAVTVVVKDVLRRGGHDYVYHLAAWLSEAPDFSLSFEEDRLQIPPQGNVILKVQAKRSGFDGPIKLRLTGLPPGIQVAEGEVPAGSDVGFCLLSGIGAGPAFGVVKINGEAVVASEPIVREAVGPPSGAAVSSPWLRGDLGIGVTASPAPLSIELVGAPESLPARLPLGGEVDLPLEIRRAGDVKGEIRLSLVSTQRMVASPAPAVPNRRRNRNRSVKPGEVAKDDLLRLGDENPISQDNPQATASVIVPSELPVGNYGLVVRADLLAVDGKTVLASSYTRPRWMNAVIPFAVKLEQANIQVRAGEGETGAIVGTIVRTDGFAGPVTLTVSGLPQGIIAPTYQVPAGECDFRLPVSLPYGVKPGPIKVRLDSLGKDGFDKSADGVVGTPIDLIFDVVPGDKPKAEKPLAIFEDEQEFADDLTEGEGVASLSNQEKYSGSTSLLVKGKPRFRTTLPGISLAIRENPGPGEYRYLRYAWKINGGGKRIGLQLIDDGLARNEPGKVAKYNLHAGPDPAADGQTAVIDRNPPSQWTVVTRDLFADFGEFTLTGIGAIFFEGKSAQFDHIYLGRSVADFDTADTTKK